MAQMNITMDDWLYGKIVARRPRGMSKSQWMRTLVVTGLENVTDLPQDSENVPRRNEPPYVLPSPVRAHDWGYFEVTKGQV